MPDPSKPDSPRKIFVLDTSVILYDFNALQNFQEHDVAIPITVLEELDQFKKGNSVLNLQAREFIRQLDKLSDAQHARTSGSRSTGRPRASSACITEENGQRRRRRGLRRHARPTTASSTPPSA